MNASQQLGAAERITFPEQRTVLDDGTVYTPFLAEGRPGLRCTRPGSPSQYIYFNPSDLTDGDVPNVFVYQGTEGDPYGDTPIHHYSIWPELIDNRARRWPPRSVLRGLRKRKRAAGVRSAAPDRQGTRSGQRRSSEKERMTARPTGECPDCGKPITLQASGWWTHDGLHGDCWRSSMDGPTEPDATAPAETTADLSE